MEGRERENGATAARRVGMAERSLLCMWPVPVGWSVGLLVVELVGSIVSVEMLADREVITLAGGIAVFAGSITAWLAIATAVRVRALRRRRLAVANESGAGQDVQCRPLANR
jgi:hypothetical protein